MLELEQDAAVVLGLEGLSVLVELSTLVAVLLLARNLRVSPAALLVDTAVVAVLVQLSANLVEM